MRRESGVTLSPVQDTGRPAPWGRAGPAVRAGRLVDRYFALRSSMRLPRVSGFSARRRHADSFEMRRARPDRRVISSRPRVHSRLRFSWLAALVALTALIPVAAGRYLAPSSTRHLDLASVAVSSSAHNTPSPASATYPAQDTTAATRGPAPSTSGGLVPPAPAVPATVAAPPATAGHTVVAASEAAPSVSAPKVAPTEAPAAASPPPGVTAPASATSPQTGSTTNPAPATAAATVASSYGCGPALSYLSAHAAPGFVFECPGNALGHQAMTCENVAGVCPGAKIIAIADPCAAAYMNEANNSWVISGLRKGTIDPYGYCT